jgi:hypothetical protein
VTTEKHLTDGKKQRQPLKRLALIAVFGFSETF